MSAKLTQNQKYDLIIAELGKILALVTPTSFVNPFDTHDFQNVPIVDPTKPAPIVVPSVDERVSKMDFSGFVDDPAKSYHSLIVAKTIKGLVYEILSNWSLRETFYQPVKDFMADWPQYFQ
jgi:hypothetical protein